MDTIRDTESSRDAAKAKAVTTRVLIKVTTWPFLNLESLEGLKWLMQSYIPKSEMQLAQLSITTGNIQSNLLSKYQKYT